MSGLTPLLPPVLAFCYEDHRANAPRSCGGGCVLLTERGVLALGSGAPLVAKGYFERALQAQPGYERAQSYLDGLGM